MDWEFLEEEVLELLDNNGLNSGSVDRLESIVRRFVIRLVENYNEEGDFDENGTDSEWDHL